MSGSHALLAVGLAVVGAVLYGLAAVRQHREVQATMSEHKGLRSDLRAILRLLRQPGWLFGAVQAMVAGAAHIGALALAPITLVQPIGVVAVPVTIVASALRRRRRPSGSQVLGSILSVTGIAVLTLLLITPPVHAVVLPAWGGVAGTIAAAVTIAAALTSRALGPAPVRCVMTAGVAAVLYGLGAVLITIIGHILGAGLIGTMMPLLVTAVLGLALTLPVGLWAMQSAYLRGSPHVVICCLTLIDPISAVVGGHLLLHAGVAAAGLTFVAAIGCALLAAVGVLLLSLDYPAAVAVESNELAAG